MKEEIRQIFDNLVSNSFEFLNRSIDEFKKEDTKCSIVHFCIAVENILKAELLWVHWSLVFKNPGEASWVNFINSNFSSASLNDTLDRLEKIGKRTIMKEARQYFRNIASERNKIIHYFNNNVTMDLIAKDQMLAWYYLDALLRKWNRHFRNFSQEISNFRKRMVGHQKYLGLRYDMIKARLQKLDKSKFILSTCPICGFNSLVSPYNDLRITLGKCHVCEHEWDGIILSCPNCDKLTFITDKHITTCSCRYEIQSRELFSLLESAYAYSADIRHGEEIDWQANCTECDSTFVIKVSDNLWFCTECFTKFNQVSICDWCNQLYTGDKNDTYILGCGTDSCQGRLGIIDDD